MDAHPDSAAVATEVGAILQAELKEDPLYADRVQIYPKAVQRVRFRLIKWIGPDGWSCSGNLLLRALDPLGSRGEGAPDQAVLVDSPGRRFYFFFIEIWPQESTT